MKWQAPDLVPSLAYRDVLAAIAWLTRVFGFRERIEARLTSDNLSNAWVELGSVLINITSAGGHELQSPATLGGASVTLKVYVADVDAHFRAAKAAGAEIISEPENGFWGGRIYRARDLEGHLWEFSQAGVDLDAKEWKLPPGVRRGA